MRLVKHPELIAAWPKPTAADPWIIMISGCMMGFPCGVDGTDYGFGGVLDDIAKRDTVRVVSFCPEDIGLGTPRTMPDIHGGDGFDGLAGHARVLDEHGSDLTDGMIAGALAMAAKAQEEQVRFAILMDMSAACGSQVIADGCRSGEPPPRQRGVGVATAVLARVGIPLVSQRDHRTLGLVRARLDAKFVADPEARDHHEIPWVRKNLPDDRVWPT